MSQPDNQEQLNGNNTQSENKFADFNKLVHKLKQIIYNLTQDNFKISVEQTKKLFDISFPYSHKLLLCNLIYSIFYSKKENNYIYLNYLEALNKDKPKIIKIFCNYLSKINSQESYYLILKMIEKNLVDLNDKNVLKKINPKYRIYVSEDEIIYKFSKYFSSTSEIFSKEDFGLDKKLVEEGFNPNEIAKIIRNDEIEKLQEISSKNDFDFNQTIEPSLYERCSFINQEDVSLIDYAAFFGSIKCFKFLLMNDANVENTGKYAVAGGNIEIIHLCEQNNSSFDNACEAAIKFHKNDIFKYIYEKKIEQIDFEKCLKYSNYDILSYLLIKEMKINKSLIDYIAQFGNLYLMQCFLQNDLLSGYVLFSSIKSENFELVKFIVEQKVIDINVKDV